VSQPDPQPDPSPRSEPSRDALVAALGSAFRAQRGVPPDIEPLVRQYGRALREGGAPIEKAVVHVKALVRNETHGDEALFIGKLVGWAIAGYFGGTEPSSRRPRE